MKAIYGRILMALLVVAAVVALLSSPLADWLTLDGLKARRAELALLLEQRPALVIGGFLLLYVTATALSIPGALVLTLAAGAIFGLWLGVLIVSFASAIGASLAFLGSRYLFRGWVKARFGRQIAAIDRGIERDGIFYLLALRLNPAVPYFLVNLGMGLTRKRLVTFYLVSQIGMLPATFVYVNAGTQLGRIRELDDVLSPALIGSLVLLSLFPLIGKLVADWLRRRRVYRGWRRPMRFDRNLIVIGAGAGGLVTAYVAATARAKVTLIEAKEMGGDCLNTGCVPSKTLIRCARAAHELRHADKFGIAPGEPRVCFRDVMERVHAAIAAIAPHDSAERYRGLGVDVRQGHARLVDPWTVEIDGGKRLTARAIVIAAGAEPAVPEIPGLADCGYLTSDTMWHALRGRDWAPERLAIVGGGPIGCELAQAFARLGSQVTVVEHGERILAKEDEEAAALVAERLRREGIALRTGHEAVRVEGRTLVARCGPAEVAIPFDEIIVAVGRKARLSGYGLETLGVEADGTVATDRFLRTRLPHIFAVGDVAGPYQFTHFAAHQAWYAAVNALFGGFWRFRADYRVVPRVTFTDPELAHVGHSEESARETGIGYELVRYGLGQLDRAVTEGATEGFVKLLVAPGKDRILGATVVAASAGETIAELALAMKANIGLKRILATVHAYPTMAEANRYAAGEWRKANVPERLLRLAERWHAWRRG
ncbi:MAG: FAD-dependent oxidoreductase [Pseudomonadota bacterium]|nr:FAD-dependent oxidoreductase [Pseudomonadota bacterium]